MSSTPKHHDFLGREIKVGDVCIYSGGKGQYCGFHKRTVTKLNPKRVTFTSEEDHTAWTIRKHHHVEPNDVLVITSLLETT